MDQPLPAGNTTVTPGLLPGGEMEQRIREYDWTATSLQAVEAWPQSLRSALSICLHASFPIAIYWGRNLTLLYNNAWGLAVGSKHPAALGKPAREVWAEAWDNIGSPLEKALSGHPADAKNILLPQPGSAKQASFNFTFTPIFGEGGTVEGVFSTATESLPVNNGEALVSQEPIAAQRKMEENERRFSTLIQQVGAGIASTSLEGKFLEINSRFCAITGYSEEELLQKNMMEITHPDDLPNNLLLLKQCIEDGQDFIVEKRYIRKDGTAVWVSNSVSLIESRSGEKFLAAISIDITERRQVQQMLQESEERYATTVNASDLGLWDFDVLNQKIVAAGKMAEIYGLSSNEDFTLQTLFESIHPQEAEAQQKLYADIVEGKVSKSFETEYRIVKKSTGAISWVRAKGFVFFDEKETLYRTVGTVADITEQKIAAEKIKESNERLQAALNASLTGTFRWNIQTAELSWDENLDKLFGLPLGQTVQNLEKFIERIHPDDQQIVIEACRRCAEEGADFDEEFRVIWPDGSIHWLDDKGKTFFDKDGKPLYMTGACVDITARQSAAEKIRVSEERFRYTFENAAVGVAHVGLDGSWLFINNRICEIMGYRKEEMLELTFQDITYPEDLQTDLDYLQQLQAGFIRTYSIEKRYIRKDGSLVWANLTVSLLKDEQDQPAHFVSIVQDISERKKAEEALAYQKSLLETVTENTDMALFLMDDRQYCVYMNEAAEQMTGFTLAELKGKQLHYHIHHTRPDGSPYPLEECPIDQALPSQARVKGEDTFLKKDGSFFPVAFTASPIIVSGKAIGTVIEVRNTTEEKRKEQALIESQRELHFAIEATELGVWDYNPIKDKLSGNKRLKEWFGLPPTDDIVLTDALNIITDEDRGAVVQAIQTALTYSSGGNYDATYTIVHPQTGQERIVRAKGKTTFDENKVACRFSGTLQDITPEATVQRRLEESEERFRSLANAMPQVVWIAKADGEVTYYNDRVIGFKGVRKLPDGSWSWIGTLHPDDAEATAAAWNLAIETGTVYQKEHRILMTDDSYRWHLSRALPQKDEEGQLLKWYGTATDIHEQKLANEAVLESESRFRTLAETLPQMIWVTDEKGVNEYFSHQWLHYAGVENPYEAWDYMIHPDEKAAANAAFEKAFAAGQPFRTELRLKNKEGVYHWHSSIAEPVVDAEGNVMKWVGAITNIHDQKTLTEKLEKLVAERTVELAQANRELHRSNEDLQQFAHVASHDLKEPVRKVLTFSSRLKEELGSSFSERALTYLSKIEGASLRMYSMIDGVLLYSSLNALEQTKELIDLTELLENVQSDLELSFQQKQAVLEAGNLPSLEGSNILIYQLFYNLVNNSLKFARPNVPAVIQITAETAGEEEVKSAKLNERKTYIKIVLRDNGIGFDNEDAEKIFGTFTRLHSKDKYEGTGLGLSLCRKIVERHGGTIWAEGKENEGAKFTLLLPA